MGTGIFEVVVYYKLEWQKKERFFCFIFHLNLVLPGYVQNKSSCIFVKEANEKPMKSRFCKITPKHRFFCPKKVQNVGKKDRVKEKEERVGAKETT